MTLQNALNKAKTLANETPQNLPAPANEPAAGVPAVNSGGPSRSLADHLQGGMSVDDFLKVKDEFLMIGGDRTKFEKIAVIIDLSAVQPTMAVKYGNPPTYHKTFNGETTDRGLSWRQVCSEALKVDPLRGTPYRSVDIPMVLAEDLNDPKTGKTIFTAGMRIGYSTPTTGLGEFEALFREATKNGLQNERVTVDLGSKVRSNKNGQSWGVVTFTLTGADDGEAAAA